MQLNSFGMLNYIDSSIFIHSRVPREISSTPSSSQRQLKRQTSQVPLVGRYVNLPKLPKLILRRILKGTSRDIVKNLVGQQDGILRVIIEGHFMWP